jgi:HPt (histidine-containing phosphotransfer) domain-containing protein
LTDPPRRHPVAPLEDKLAALRATYRSALPEQLDTLARLLDDCGGAAGALEDAWRLAHRLQGTSGSYGFSQLAEQLETIEESLERARRMHSPATDDERARAVAALGRARALLG